MSVPKKARRPSRRPVPVARDKSPVLSQAASDRRAAGAAIDALGRLRPLLTVQETLLGHTPPDGSSEEAFDAFVAGQFMVKHELQSIVAELERDLDDATTLEGGTP